MKFTGKMRRLFACMASALFIIACSQTPKPNKAEPPPDPAVAGEGLMRSMSNTLAQSKAFTFETSEQLEVMATSGEKRVVHLTRKVTVRRPNGLFFEVRLLRRSDCHAERKGEREVGADKRSRHARRNAGRRDPKIWFANPDRRCGLQLSLRRPHRKQFEGRTCGA
jgi:hypothetical protein